MGSESLLIQCAELWLSHGNQISAVISDDGAILDWATQTGIPTLTPNKQLATQTAEYDFDYFFSVANLKIVPADLLAQANIGAFNFHDGPLPHYAGLYTPAWALINQEAEHGVTWHKMEATIDTGDIAIQKKFQLKPDETSMSLNVRCFEEGIHTFGRLVEQLSSQSLILQPQTLTQQNYYAKHKRPTAAATLDWSQSAESLDALMRALNFGGYDNPLAVPKIYLRDHFVLVTHGTLAQTASQEPAGTIISADGDRLTVSTATANICFDTFILMDGSSIGPLELFRQFGLQVGDVLPELSAAQRAEMSQINQRIARHEGMWRKRLAELTDFEIPYAKQQLNRQPAFETSVQTLPQSIPADRLTAIFAAYLLRMCDQQAGSILLQADQTSGPFAQQTPLPIRQRDTVAETLDGIEKAIQRSQKAETFAHDLLWRDPALAHLPLSVTVGQDGSARPTTPLFLQTTDSQTLSWTYDSHTFAAEAIAQMQGQFTVFMAFVNDPANKGQALADAPLLSEAEQETMLFGWNETWQDYPANDCIHQQFMARAAQMPEATAVEYWDRSLSYQELDERSNQLAHYLISLGVGPDVPVGIFMERTPEIIVGLFAILKAGGAYLPLDPDYPADRLAFMVADTSTPVLLTQSPLVGRLPEHTAAVVQIDSDWKSEISHLPKTAPRTAVTSSHLSYIIYTSGSTGRPKGVMIEHRNVINFFAGMDERIPHEIGDRWLAVTSLSFDISVLEIFWTLCRGLTVILHNRSAEGVSADAYAQSAIDFSLYYFASDEAEQGLTNKYDLLLEGAKFADAHGFSAVWTPERHFHAFGGLYPNPSVIGGALATLTQNVQIRAGSVVLPLHHPARVAEEWAVVDNLSNGRVGISFAAGWQPNDFVFQPQNFADRKNIMFEQIDEVRRLWRGESISYNGGIGPVDVQTLPRPVQAELPAWVTAAGNPDTFRQAGANGHNLLTHLLGQTVDELGEKIALYRQAWRESGHAGLGHVTILLHTFIGPDLEQVREMVRGPMTDYLRSSLFLIRQAAWSFPTFKQKADETGQTPLEVFESEALSDDEMEALLGHSFQRYFEDSSLLGDLEKGIGMVNKMKRIGVNEIACQVDFGVSTAETLAHLPYLNELRQRANQTVGVEGGGLNMAGRSQDGSAPFDPYPNHSATGGYSIPALLERHAVTHFQCTPSMMGMLLGDPQQQRAMGRLKVCMLGGEALPQSLAAETLSHLSKDGRLINMYGPTETTIWSSTHEVGSTDRPIPVGRPIANTALYIVDDQLRPVPPGMPGELLIGGDGVVRGYHNRPDLTAERFVPDPFRRGRGFPRAKLYRTGDLARFRPDGTVEFLGRIDFQVKLRGFRIELGEIEALLASHASVREAVVTVREDAPGDKRMVAYLIPQAGRAINPTELRDSLKETLPSFMIPAHFVEMSEFPLTPNRKTDRGALPAPALAEPAGARPTVGFEPVATDYQKQIADIWQSALGVGRISIHDNFFELGGHSILAVQVHRQMREQLQVDLTIADMFRYATIASISAYLGDQDAPVLSAHQTAVARAAKRRKALGLNGTRRRQ